MIRLLDRLQIYLLSFQIQRTLSTEVRREISLTPGILTKTSRNRYGILMLSLLKFLDRFLIYQRYFRFASTEELAAKTGLTRHAVDTRL